ncbi:hypothetical protein K474DRAFT_1062874 [Panus rudis PR-1116 ss-1]|nr:hypothetical protein K474DRAFT_1062874 [Panus rudis PR-1116 ss-1]
MSSPMDSRSEPVDSSTAPSRTRHWRDFRLPDGRSPHPQRAQDIFEELPLVHPRAHAVHNHTSSFAPLYLGTSSAWAPFGTYATGHVRPSLEPPAYSQAGEPASHITLSPPPPYPAVPPSPCQTIQGSPQGSSGRSRHMVNQYDHESHQTIATTAQIHCPPNNSYEPANAFPFRTLSLLAEWGGGMNGLFEDGTWRVDSEPSFASAEARLPAFVAGQYTDRVNVSLTSLPRPIELPIPEGELYTIEKFLGGIHRALQEFSPESSEDLHMEGHQRRWIDMLRHNVWFYGFVYQPSRTELGLITVKKKDLTKTFNQIRTLYAIEYDR